MTRINTINPKYLTSPHLRAEYRELPRIFTAVLKLQNKGLSPADIEIPETYRLGAGHVKFFYDKCGWLLNRYRSIKNELLQREFNLNLQLYRQIKTSALQNIKEAWRGHWQPDPADHYLNMARLAVRSKIPTVTTELTNGTRTQK